MDGTRWTTGLVIALVGGALAVGGCTQGMGGDMGMTKKDGGMMTKPDDGMMMKKGDSTMEKK